MPSRPVSPPAIAGLPAVFALLKDEDRVTRRATVESDEKYVGAFEAIDEDPRTRQSRWRGRTARPSAASSSPASPASDGRAGAVDRHPRHGPGATARGRLTDEGKVTRTLADGGEPRGR